MISKRIYIEPNANHRNHQNIAPHQAQSPLALHWAVQAATSDGINKALYNFLQSLQTNAGTIPRLDHDIFIPNLYVGVSHPGVF